MGAAHVGGDRRAALRPRLPAGLPPHRQPARRRGPDPRRVHPRLPVAALLPARHLRGLAAPHHDQRVPRQDAPQAADPLRRPVRRVRRPAAQPETGPEAAFDATHFDDDVQRALDALSPDFRAAVVLCDIEGLSYEEIAATLGVKLGTVRSRIHRGRAQLREALAHRDPAGPPRRRRRPRARRQAPHPGARPGGAGIAMSRPLWSGVPGGPRRAAVAGASAPS